MDSPHVLWRISNYHDLSGIGGSRGDARWHTATSDRRIVYLTENSATALLEMLANLKGDPRLFPETYQLMRIELDAQVSCLEHPRLKPGWQQRMSETQAIGDAWLKARKSALLAVPSVPSARSTNYLFNPLHPDAAHVRIHSVERLPFDKRLFHMDLGK